VQAAARLPELNPHPTRPVNHEDTMNCRSVSSNARLDQLRARLGKLLIDFRRIDFREKIAGLDLSADIQPPIFDVTAGTRVDGGFIFGLHRARKYDLLLLGYEVNIGRAGRTNNRNFHHDGAATSSGVKVIFDRVVRSFIHPLRNVSRSHPLADA
jgi:hypothetical protein